MQHRGLRVVQMERAIVMMMVSLFLPVQCSMRQIGHHIDRRSGARHGHRLPNHGKQHKENREPTNHRETSVANLTDYRRAHGQAGLTTARSRMIPKSLSLRGLAGQFDHQTHGGSALVRPHPAVVMCHGHAQCVASRAHL
jgi:hypothetical protein